MTQDVWRAAPHDDAIAFTGDFLDDLMCQLDHLVSVENLVFADRQGPFMTAAPEDLGQPMHQRVAFLGMLRYCFLVHSRELGDLAGELLIEKLPSLAARQAGRPPDCHLRRIRVPM